MKKLGKLRKVIISLGLTFIFLSPSIPVFASGSQLNNEYNQEITDELSQLKEDLTAQPTEIEINGVKHAIGEIIGEPFYDNSIKSRINRTSGGYADPTFLIVGDPNYLNEYVKVTNVNEKAIVLLGHSIHSDYEMVTLEPGQSVKYRFLSSPFIQYSFGGWYVDDSHGDVYLSMKTI